MSYEPVEKAAVDLTDQPLPGPPDLPPPFDVEPVGIPSSSTVRVVGGILIASEGLATIVASLVRGLPIYQSGHIPGLTSALNGGIVRDANTAGWVSVVVTGLIWTGLGIMVATSAQRLASTATWVLVAMILLGFVPSIETYLWIQKGVIPWWNMLLSIVLSLASLVSVWLLILAAKAAGDGRPFSGLISASIVLRAILLGFSVLSLIESIWLYQTHDLPMDFVLPQILFGLLSGTGMLLWAVSLIPRAVDVHTPRLGTPADWPV